jgi:hypothetical protein
LHSRGKPKKYILQGGNPKGIFCRGKAKMTYFAGGKDLFTLFKNIIKMFVMLSLKHQSGILSQQYLY